MNYLLISEDCTSKKLNSLGNCKIPYNKIIVFKNDHLKFLKNKIGSRKSIYLIDQKDKMKVKTYTNSNNKFQNKIDAEIAANIFSEHPSYFSIPIEFFNRLNIGAPKFFLKYGHFNDCPKILKILQNIIIYDAKRVHMLGMNSDRITKFYSMDRTQNYFLQDKYYDILLFLTLTTYYNNVSFVLL